MALISREMSVSTYQELSDYRNVFSCLLCLEFFSNPRVLDCHHIFCEQCLELYYGLFKVIRREHSLVMRCPTCRQLSTTLTGGPLPMDMTCDRFLLTKRKMSRPADQAPKCDACSMTHNRCDQADFFCNKCAINMCRPCRAIHDQHHLFVGHVVVHVTNKETLDLCCDKHSKMPSVYFCHDCDLAVCVVCILHSHSAHETSKLRVALAARRDHLKNILNQLGPRLDKVDVKVRRLESLTTTSNNTTTRTMRTTATKTTKTKSNENSDNQRVPQSTSNDQRCGKASDVEVLLCRETNHLSVLDRKIVRSASSPENYVAGCSRKGSYQIANTNACNSNDSEWCIVKTTSSESSSTNSSESLLQFNFNSEMNALMSAVTESIERRSRRHREQMKAERNSGDNEEEEEEAEDLGDQWESKEEVLTLLKMELTRHRKLFKLSTKVLDTSQSKKFFAIYDDIVDRIRTVLEVELPLLQDVLEERIAVETILKRKSSSGSEQSGCDACKNSAFAGAAAAGGASSTDSDCGCLSMLIRPKLLWKVEKQRSDVTEMWNPCDVTFLPDETAIVAEYDNISDRNNKLQLFDRAGRPLASLAQGQLQPLGVAVTREGHIAVTDCKGKRIKILTTTGQTLAEIGKGQFGWPYGIAVNSRSQLIVTDAFNDTVSVYQMDGKRIRTFGSTGSQNSQFRNPYHVTVDARDNIIVSDSGNSCVKVFDSSGRFRFCTTDPVRKTSIDCAGGGGGCGVGGGERAVARRRKLRGPRGVTVDLRGNILVADDCCRVCMFDSNGRFVRNLLTEEDSVKFPEAVHCSRLGLLAVTEWNPNNMFAVKIFNMYE